MRRILLFVFLLISEGLFSQSKSQVDVLSPKPSISINGVACNIGNTIWSCTPKSCDSLIITEGDSIEFCTFNEIYLNTDSNYYMQWNFSGSDFSTTIYDSFPNITPICYSPKWTTAGNYTVDIYYNGWLSAYPYSDCWAFGPSHWIINITVLANTGIKNLTSPRDFTCEVFPNPGDGIFNLEISNPKMVTAIFITDVMGRKITVPKNENQIDLSTFPNGIYFLNIQTKEGFLIKKLVKK